MKGTNKLRPISRMLAALCSLALVFAIFLPIWRIELDAPQYPEGLELLIFTHKLGGEVEIVNGLNHYIGMRTLHVDDFMEFSVLPYCIGALAFFGLIVAWANRKKVLYAWFITLILFAATAAVDFYRWLYDYGHNLDPTAPIQVPGMSYQPPMLGFKQLLNFGVFSVPDLGGWLMILAGAVLGGLVIFELGWLKNLKKKKLHKSVLAVIIIFLLQACSSQPKPIDFGTDNCDHCQMTLSDERYGAELITNKGRIYKFDDLHCIKGFLQSGNIDNKDVASIWFVDFVATKRLISSESSILLRNEELKSPMGSNIAVFATEDEFNNYQQKYEGTKLSWKDYLNME